MYIYTYIRIEKTSPKVKPYLFLWELKVFVNLFYIRLFRSHDPVIGKKIPFILHLDQSLCPFLHVLAPPNQQNWYVSIKMGAAFWHHKFRKKSAADLQTSYNLS